MINYQTNSTYIYDVARILDEFADKQEHKVVPARMSESMNVNVSSIDDAMESFKNSCEKDPDASEFTPIILDDYAQGIKNFFFSLKYKNVICYITGNMSKSMDKTEAELEIVSTDLDIAKEAMRLLFKPIALEEKEKETIDVKFWSWNGKKASAITRELEGSYIDDVIENYNKETADEILSLRDNFFDRNGKLVIFSGDPGTGKTTIIRSFARDWKDKAVLDYIIDPVEFFNGTPSYMIEVIMSGKQNMDPEDWEYDFYSTDELARKSKKKILVLEDCGELIKSEAKTDVGSGLARFLNIVDGMIGQGLDLTVLLTTNEKIENFHSAVTREGRVNTMIDFEQFSVEETQKWLLNREVELTDEIKKSIEKNDGLTLAECYDALNKQENKSVKIKSSTGKKQSFGFAIA